jgi:hypothetical protein
MTSTSTEPTTTNSEQPAVTSQEGGNDFYKVKEKEDLSLGASSWRPIRCVPVLREAAEQWYYYCSNGDGKVQGPVHCKSLATTIVRSKQPQTSSSSSSSSSPEESASSGSMNDYYFSSSLTNSAWKRIHELPDLQIAMRAFEDTDDNVSEKPSMEYNQQSTKSVDPEHSKEIHDELEAFLSSTDHLGNILKRKRQQPQHDDNYVDYDDDDDQEAYESDNGTRYVKDPRTGNWVHEALYLATNPQVPQKSIPNSNKQTNISSSFQNTKQSKTNKKQHKPKFSARKARCWIYVTGLPDDCMEEEIAETFSKVGILDLDPETQKPKIKLYRHKDGVRAGAPKGDASICYARPESVELAIQVLDGTAFRHSAPSASSLVMNVQPAKFEQQGDRFDDSRGRISNAKRKVAKLATMQAMDWDEGEYNGRLTGGRKGLRIIVLKHVFRPSQFENADEEEENRLVAALAEHVKLECEQWGTVEKITVFSKNPEGVVVIKFTQPGAASEAVHRFNGRMWRERRIEAIFWDGVTDYTVKDEIKEQLEEEKRQAEFGDWLESHELPEELRLQTE